MLLVACGPEQNEKVQEQAKNEIVRALIQWPKDFNAGNGKEACGLFAPNLIATYPGAPDRDYEQMCAHLTKIFTDKSRHYSYETPHIEQVLIEGNQAVVRLIWTLSVVEQGQSEATVIKERGLDVFERQEDGSWKIAISYAYTIEE